MPRYELSDGTSNKFWELTLNGNDVTTTYGRIGTAGQSTTKSFDSADEAKSAGDKLIAEKTRKGYVLAGGASAVVAPTTPAPKTTPADTKAPAATTPAVPVLAAPSAPRRSTPGQTLLASLPEANHHWAFNCDVSPDGAHVVYKVPDPDKGDYFVLDGVASPPCEALLGPWFAEDGRLLYREGGRWHIGDETHDKYIRSALPVISPDGKHHCYIAKKGKTWRLVLDGEMQKDAYESFFGDPVFSPDGKRIAFVIEVDKKRFVVVDGQVGPECREPSNLVFSPDSSKLAYCVRSDQPVAYHHVVCDSFKSEQLNIPTQPGFTPTGELFFPYKLFRESGFWIGQKQVLVARGTAEAAFFHDDGTLAAYVAQDVLQRRSFLDRGNEKTVQIPLYQDAIFRAPDRLAITVNKMTTHQAMLSLASRMVMWVNGRESEEFDIIKHPTFSADGKTVRFGAIRGREAWWVVMAV